MIRSIALSDVKVCVARVMTAAIPEIGRKDTPGQHRGGDERAGRQFSVQHQIDAHQDHQNGS